MQCLVFRNVKPCWQQHRDRGLGCQFKFYLTPRCIYMQNFYGVSWVAVPKHWWLDKFSASKILIEVQMVDFLIETHMIGFQLI